MAYSLPTARELVLAAGKKLVEEGLIARTWGNISARVSDDEFVITPSGRSYDTLTPEDMVPVRIADMSYSGRIRPSSEKGVHTAIYRARPEVNFVIHTHQAYASALSVSGRDIEAAERIPCSPYGRNGSEQIMENMSQTLAANPDSGAILMQHHGAVCFAGSMEETFAACRRLEHESRAAFARALGGNAPDIPFGLTCETPAGDFASCKPTCDPELIPEGKQGAFLYLPYVRRYSAEGRDLPAYIDDFAQMLGCSIACIPDPKDTEAIRGELAKKDAVLIRNVGGIAAAKDPADLTALFMVIEKNCLAAALAGQDGMFPLDQTDAIWDHQGYLDHYSKLAQTNR
ncbi:MAG: class II aldolase/adducin family protein [Lachnospiraceae bacterium]